LLPQFLFVEHANIRINFALTSKSISNFLL
jgi:hypothetical protein